MPLFNKHGAKRVCYRCRREDATTQIKSEWLGPLCLQKRMHRQNEEAVRPRCSCGNHAMRDSRLCRSCLDAEDTIRQEAKELDGEMRVIESLTTIDGIKAYLLSKLVAGSHN